jgi:hypothetical protein
LEWAVLKAHKRRRELSNKNNPKKEPNQPEFYKIRLNGQLDTQWTEWFEGMSITLEEDGNTLLTGTVIDQAALHGILKKVRDLGMPLISESPVEFRLDGTS